MDNAFQNFYKALRRVWSPIEHVISKVIGVCDVQHTYRCASYVPKKKIGLSKGFKSFL